MEEHYVSLVRCEDYERDSVLPAVKKSIDLLGGIDKFVPARQRILLKPNLLRAAVPERHITTHFQVVYSVVRLLKDLGCEVIIADSPGIPPYNNPSKLYASSRLDEVAKETGATLNFDTSYKIVQSPQGRKMNSFPIIKAAAEADAIVVVSKAKTHLFTGMTGAAKNMYGVVSGPEKSIIHAKYSDTEDFSDVIIDLNELMKPTLQIMDAIIGLEGNGPSAGDPRKIGAILASSDYTAIDVVASQLMSFDPREVSTIRAAMRRGLVDKDLSNIRIIGDKIEDLAVKDFKKPHTEINPLRGHLNSFIGIFARQCVLYPAVIKDKCTGCETCFTVCPKKTISMIEKKANVREKGCIRCYCCHEMCPMQAIGLQRRLVGRILYSISNSIPHP